MALQLFPERDCATCTAHQKKAWGCFGDAPFEDLGSPGKTCIRRPLLDNPRWFNELFTAYKMYGKGFLPVQGGYLDQSVPYIQAMNIIDATISECEDIEKEKEERKRKNRKRAEMLTAEKNG